MPRLRCDFTRTFAALLATTALCGLSSPPSTIAREAKLVRYPHYHGGKITFSYLADIWVANEDGSSPQRITINKARDYRSRFSPDGKWIAFSSDRSGNIDIYVIPSTGGTARAITQHSADDELLNWTPDSKGVLFTSQRGEDFMPKLYVASLDGGAVKNAGPDMGVNGSYSPDGKKLAINRKAQSYWRKFYRGAYQSDVTLMDVGTKTFTDLTDFPGMDTWPVYGTDGFIYFVSDRDGNGLTNLWRVSEKGGAAEKVTQFTAGDVRFPSISSDGKTIVFEHDFGVWKLDVATKKATPIKLDITSETQELLVEWRDFNSEVEDYDVAPDGKRVAISIRGEIFTVPTDEGDIVQITDTADRDHGVDYSPDGKLLSYVSDHDGLEQIYVVPVDGTGPPKRITNLDSMPQGFEWSPDSKQLLLTTSDGKLMTIDADGKSSKVLLTSKYGEVNSANWSPDGKMVVYSRPDVSRLTDIYLLPVAGGEEKKITFDSSSEFFPRFSSDGKKVYFVRRQGGEESGPGGFGRAASRIFVIPLEKLEKDPLEASTDTQGGPAGMMRRMGGMPGMPGGAGGGGDAPAAIKPPVIDWAGLKRRTRAVTPATVNAGRFITANDGRTIIFVGSEGGGSGGGGGGGGSSLYSIGDDGKRLTRISSGTTPTETPAGDGPRGGGRRFFGGGISNLALTRDGRTIFFQEGDGVYSTSMGGTPVADSTPSTGGGAGGGGGPGGGRGGLAAMLGGGGGGGGGSRKKVTFNVKVKIERPSEWAQMFGDAWRTMKYRFYDPKMHGSDWEGMKAKYAPLVEFVGDRHELMNVINEMIGELNASHTGAAASAARSDVSSVSTGHLALDFETDPASGRYRVKHIYEGGPADADWIKISKGDYLISLNGKNIKAGDDYEEMLNRRLNKKVALQFNNKPVAAGAWTVKYEPISNGAFAELRYNRWVEDRRAMADKLSGGRVGYIHIKAMDQPSLRKFETELREFRHKEALIIDERFNGGGNIEQELLALLVQKQYQVCLLYTSPSPRD